MSLSPEDIQTLFGVVVGAVGGWFLRIFAQRMTDQRLFDHRLRLEKEYGLYIELWDKLFELRRAVGQLINSVGSTNVVHDEQQTLQLFNAYQQTVRKGEPFMSESVYSPAREIVTYSHKIINNAGRSEHYEQQYNSGHPVDDETHLKIADKRVALDEENDSHWAEIERLFQVVSHAIRKRVTP